MVCNAVIESIIGYVLLVAISGVILALAAAGIVCIGILTAIFISSIMGDSTDE